jgi:hypothetical protein
VAVEHYQYPATIPAATAKATPVTVKFAVPVRVVDALEVEVPDGTRGLVGFYLAFSGQQVIPYTVGQWIVWNDKERTFPLEAFPVTGAWSLVGYNTGVNAHTITVRFHVSLIPHVAAPLTIEATGRKLGLVFPLAFPEPGRESATSGLGLGVTR